MRLKLAILMFLCAAMTVVAQEFTYVDWNVLKADSFPAYYNEVIPLEEDYNDYRYEVTLDYPEYKQLTAKETKDVANWAESLSSEPLVTTNVTVSRKKGFLDVSFIPIVKRGNTCYKLMSFKMKIHRRPQLIKRNSALKSSSSRYVENSVLAQGRWVKIGITADGVYRLTPSDLQKMGFRDVSRVKLFGYGGHVQDEKINADTDFDDLEEVPLYRDQRGVLFYGKGLVSWSAPDASGKSTHRSNTYANQACYFLTEGDAPLSIRVGNEGVTATERLTTVPSNTLYKKEEYSWYSAGRTFYESFNYASSNTRSYLLETIDAVPSDPAQLTISFSANSSSAFSVTPTVNGEQQTKFTIAKVPSSYYAAMETTKTYQVKSLLKKDNSGTQVILTSKQGVDARLSYIELNYVRHLKLTTPCLSFRHHKSGKANFVINTNGRAHVQLWRLGRRGEPMAEMKGVLQGTTYTVPVDDATREYVAVDVDADYPSPTYVGEISNQNLHALSFADMVIIIPASGELYAQAERLAEAHRAMDGMRVHVVRADMVYNEFSSGTPDATAYRRMMKMFYDRATNESDMPRYLLLFGDGVWDNRMLTSATRGLEPNQYLLCYESQNSLSHTSSYVMEDYFGLLDDGEGASLKENKVDLGIGRFPVTSERQAQIMVDKTIEYMQNKNAGPWKNVICVMGDDGDNNQHLEMAEEIAQLVEKHHPEMQVNRILWDAYKRVSTTTSNTYPGVEADVKKQMDEGCLIMNYMGHGNPRSLSHEQAILLDDFNQFTSNKVPLWFTAACDVSPFDMIEDNIGERAVLHPTGSAIAFVGTTRTVYATQNSMINRHYIRYALGKDENGKRYSIGDALRLAKLVLLNSDRNNPDKDRTENKLHYVLLGDPALVLGMPEYKVVVESINGIPVKGTNVTTDFKAGSMAEVAGYITDESGVELSDYSGVISTSVYDSESLITCLNNDGQSDEQFTYLTRDKRLYLGSDSVRQGRFSITFPIPMDIKYSGENGRIVLYAIDNERKREANGYSEKVLVGGTDNELLGDKDGPAITAYLNREDFVWGGKVNSTPYFVAKLEDKSGINTTGTSVGHDLELVIDNNPMTTYVLNSNYVNELGDYSKGQLAFVIPHLETGKHTLTFRAWDTMNNSSSVTFDFFVDASLAPEMISMTCSENPAREQTTFFVHYDRPGTECAFKLEVFDFSGRTLWSHTEKGTTANGIYPVRWNLTTSSGMPLPTGVYLYRVSLMSGETKAVSRTNKIVILRNK